MKEKQKTKIAENLQEKLEVKKIRDTFLSQLTKILMNHFSYGFSQKRFTYAIINYYQNITDRPSKYLSVQMTHSKLFKDFEEHILPLLKTYFKTRYHQKILLNHIADSISFFLYKDAFSLNTEQKMRQGDHTIIRQLRIDLLKQANNLWNFKKDNETKKDIIQDTIKRIWLNRHRIENGKLGGYSRKTLENVIIEYSRGIKKKNAVFASSIPDNSESPSEDILEKEKKALKNKALNRLNVCANLLSPYEQSLLHQHYHLGKSQTQMAREQNISRVNMTKKFFNLRHKMKKCISVQVFFEFFFDAKIPKNNGVNFHFFKD